MPSEPGPPVELRYTPEFKRNLRQLAKRYRRIQSDLEPLLRSLAGGQVPGDQVPGVQHEVFKARVPNSDTRKGSSGGYRVVYQRTAESAIVLVPLYSKLEQADISPHQIREIVLGYERLDEPRSEDDETDTPAEVEQQGGTTASEEPLP